MNILNKFKRYSANEWDTGSSLNFNRPSTTNNPISSTPPVPSAPSNIGSDIFINQDLHGQAFFDDIIRQIKSKRKDIVHKLNTILLHPDASQLQKQEAERRLNDLGQEQALEVRSIQKRLGLYGNQSGPNQSLFWQKEHERQWERQHFMSLGLGTIPPERMYKVPCTPDCLTLLCRHSKETDNE